MITICYSWILSIGLGEIYVGEEETGVKGQRTIMMQTMEAENTGKWICVDCGKYTMKIMYEETGEINRFCVNCDQGIIKAKGKKLSNFN